MVIAWTGVGTVMPPLARAFTSCAEMPSEPKVTVEPSSVSVAVGMFEASVGVGSVGRAALAGPPVDLVMVSRRVGLRW